MNNEINIYIKNIEKLLKLEESNKSDFIKKEGEKLFLKIEENNEQDFLILLTCWCFFEADWIRHFRFNSKQQTSLEEKIKELCKQSNQNINSIHGNEDFLIYVKQIIDKEKIEESKKIILWNFISYCIAGSNELVFWKYVNCAILNHVYINSVNELCKYECQTKNGIVKKPKFTIELLEKQEHLSTFISIDTVRVWMHLNYVFKPSLIPEDQNGPKIEKALDLLIKLVFTEEIEKDKKSQTALFVMNHLLCLGKVGFDKKRSKYISLGFCESKPGIIYCLFEISKYLDKSDFQYFFPNDIEKSMFGIFEKNRFLALINLYGLYNDNPKLKDAAENLDKYIPENEYVQLQIMCGSYEKDTPDQTILNNITYSIFSEPKEKKEMSLLAEKARCTILAFYFLMWKIGSLWKDCKPTPYDTFKIHDDLMYSFYSSFLDYKWNYKDKEEKTDQECCNDSLFIPANYCSTNTYKKLFNQLLKIYNVNGILPTLSFDLSTQEGKSTCSNMSLFLKYLRNIDEESDNTILSLMDYIAELKDKKNLNIQPSKSFPITYEKFLQLKNQLISNHQKIKEIDCGFEIENFNVYNSNPFKFPLSRSLTCRFFNDSIKDSLNYLWSTKDKSEKEKSKNVMRYEENYRATNRHNITCVCLQPLIRNPNRHFTTPFVIRNILDSSYPEHMLEAFYDILEYLENLYTKKISEEKYEETIIVKYQIIFTQTHFSYFLAKLYKSGFLTNDINIKDLNFNELWKYTYTNSGDIKEQNFKLNEIRDKEIDYKDLLGSQFVEEMEWFLNNIYNNSANLLHNYYYSISLYLIYLAFRLKDEK